MGTLATVGGLEVSGRGPFDDPPTFPFVILLPAALASLVVAAQVSQRADLEVQASRPLTAWRLAGRGLALALVLAAGVAPAAVLGAAEAARFGRNTIVLAAAALAALSVLGPVAGVLLPWLWTGASLLFGLTASTVDEPQWMWWAWLLEDVRTVDLLLVAAAAGTVVVTARRPGRAVRAT